MDRHSRRWVRSIGMSAVLGAALSVAGAAGVAGAASAAEPTVIQVGWPWGANAQQTAGFLAAVKAFNAENPDVKVEYTLAYDENKFLTAYAGGVAPDVYSVGDGGIKAYILSSYAADITPFVKADSGLASGDFVAPAWLRVVDRGAIWGLPYSADPNFALFTNRKALADAGLAAAEIQTIADFDAADLKLTKVSPDGKLQQIGTIPWDLIGGATNALFTWGYVFGGSFYDEATHQATPDDPGVVAALDWMVQHDQRHSQAQIAADLGGWWLSRFTSGQVAMWPANPPQLGGIAKAAPDLDYDITALPRTADGPENPMWIGGHTLFVTSSSKKQAAAYRFIRFAAASPEGSKLLLSPPGFFPAYLHSGVIQAYLQNEKTRIFVGLLQTASRQRATIPAFPAYGKALSDAVAAALARKESPKAALEDAARIVQPQVEAALAAAADHT